MKKEGAMLHAPPHERSQQGYGTQGLTLLIEWGLIKTPFRKTMYNQPRYKMSNNLSAYDTG